MLEGDGDLSIIYNILYAFLLYIDVNVNVNVKISRGNHPVNFPQRGGPGPHHPQIGGGFWRPGKGEGGRGPHKYEEKEGSSSEEKEGSSSEEKEEQTSTPPAPNNAKSSVHNE
jgi:hypothetical protein